MKQCRERSELMDCASTRKKKVKVMKYRLKEKHKQIRSKEMNCGV